jgi:hypothetical protein
VGSERRGETHPADNGIIHHSRRGRTYEQFPKPFMTDHLFNASALLLAER